MGIFIKFDWENFNLNELIESISEWGWRKKEAFRKDADIWEKNGQEILICKDPSSADYEQRMTETLTVVSLVERNTLTATIKEKDWENVICLLEWKRAT